jgi:hypothetical protein
MSRGAAIWRIRHVHSQCRRSFRTASRLHTHITSEMTSNSCVTLKVTHNKTKTGRRFVGELFSLFVSETSEGHAVVQADTGSVPGRCLQVFQKFRSQLRILEVRRMFTSKLNNILMTHSSAVTCECHHYLMLSARCVFIYRGRKLH